jgi:hypothetical protein
LLYFQILAVGLNILWSVFKLWNFHFHFSPTVFIFRLPTDVQAEAIPLILGGGDVLMAAETGSGKTGAFCLPIIQIVWETLKDLEAGKGSKIIAQVCKC